jgi:hypothetical protein
MAGPFAIAAVTAVLKDLLNDGMANHDLSALGNVTVTALPPDRIPVTNADEKSQLNLFLFQVAPNLGWRNNGLPSRSTTGERLTNPPLALDLRYLVTAYGKEEFHAETLLGYAMQVLHENPVLTREMIDATLKPTLPPGVSLPPGLGMLATSDLSGQVELVKITPAYLGTEEMSRLWSAMQAKYRATAVYNLSVVLIEADKARKAPLPVLKQGDEGKGPTAQAGLVPPYPAIDSVALPNNQTEALLGDVVTVSGHHFAGDTGKPLDVTVAARLVTLRLDAPTTIAVPIGARSDKSLFFTVPNTPAALPAGIYSLAIGVTPTAPPNETRFSNEVPLVVAPSITGGLGAPIARTAVDGTTGLGTATIAITCSPEILPEQRVSLVLGSKEVSADPHPTQGPSVTFVFTGMAAGEYLVRLRVDGAESILIDRSDPANLQFDPSQKLELT